MSEETNETPLQEQDSDSSSDVVTSKTRTTMGSVISLLALTMFVGGALVTLMMLARSFNIEGQTLVAFVVLSCALVLGLAGYLITNLMGDKPLLGAFIGALLGGFSGFMFYTQTASCSWWH